LLLASARRMSHGEQPARAARLYPERPALRFEGARLSYAELDRRVTRLARALRARGLAPATGSGC
jgi:non-ribosomal peptide synthetase component F